MGETLDIQTLFPTCVGTTHAPKDFGVTEYSLSLLQLDKFQPENVLLDEPVLTTYHDLMHNDVNLCKDPVYGELNAWVAHSVGDYAKALGYKGDHLSGVSWLAQNLKGEHHGDHVHANSHISAVFYIEGQEDDAPIIFKNPKTENMFSIPKERNTDYNVGGASYSPTKGKLIMFTSDIPHCIYTKKTDDLRLVMSYNFIISKDTQ